jgi:GNAT superfamily N-acetyltransferase
MARGWVFTAPDGSIAAFMANAPFLYVDDAGSRFIGMAAHTLAVRPDARGQGLARSLTNAEFREPCDFSVGVQTSPGGWRATLSGGGQNMGQEWTRKPRIVIADGGAFLRMIGRKAIGRKGPSLTLSPDQEGHVSAAEGTEIETIRGFSPSDDAALAQMVARPARVRPHRDAATLNWLYAGTPHLRATRLVLAVRKAGRLVGYAGFRVLPGSLSLLECRTLPEERDAARQLLAAARQWARARRMSHLLVYVYSEEIGEALPRGASLPAVGLSRFPYAIAIKNPALTLADLELGPWDGDAIIADDSRA